MASNRTIALLLSSIVAFTLLEGMQAAASALETDHLANAPKEGYIPVDLGKRETVNGKTLAIAAYVIVLTILLLYSGSILYRERSLKTDIEQLRKMLKKD